MVTLTTKRGKQAKLLTPSEWHERMYGRYGRSGGMVAFEQMVYQSRNYKVCIECLTQDKLIECKNHLLPTDGHHSKDYYMCQERTDYYNNK
ncbi:hypothetical protein LCGC14_1016030 [marine sediment metagenome]|uniref:Uncharacterized protein n=1 Tax=marine sediment metagenome TaxID=412755 RepID=A0A0F9N3D1_9ZZZZ